MRIFRTKGITVVDYFTEERRPLPSECVVFEFSEQEWEQLDHENITWITDCAYVTEFVSSAKLLRFYVVLLTRTERWLAFREVSSSHLSLPTAVGLFSMIRRVPFELNGRPAFDLLSFLFIDLSNAISRGKRWEYRSEWKYQIRGLPEKWCIGVTVPQSMVGLLIGPRGQTIAKVESLTDYIENRISFSD